MIDGPAAPGGAPQRPTAVVKMAGLPRKIAHNSSTLAAGHDASPEMYFSTVLRELVRRSIAPTVLLGYGTWFCDDFLKRRTVAPPLRGAIRRSGVTHRCLAQGTPWFDFQGDCKKRVKEHEAHKKARGKLHAEQRAPTASEDAIESGRTSEADDMCSVVVASLENLHFTPSMQHEAMEVQPASLQQGMAFLAEAYGGDDLRRAIKTVFFQIVYTVAAWQRAVPGLRHNDMSWYNIRVRADSALLGGGTCL